MLDNENLTTEITGLINSHREGGYWDFKQEWYSKEKSSDMVHDIICMANNLENRDAYIIIGVTDNFALCDIENDQHRRTTQNLTDFLKSKKFAGDFRPTVEVRSIMVDDVLLDIICVNDNEYVPYYLTDKYKAVFPYHIYTRVQDSNTAIDKSADLIHVEMLWQKRFHLLDSPLQKMKTFLKQKKDWIGNVSTEMGTIRYYKYSPEYTIKTERLEGDITATYTLSQIDKQASGYIISLWYHQTILFQADGVFLDGGRYMTVQPAVGSFEIKNKLVYYYYLCKNWVKFALYEFFIHNEDSRDSLANREYTKEILFFNDEYERENFEIYLHRNMKNYELYVQNVKADTQRRTIPTTQGYDYQDEYDHRLALKMIYKDYCDYFKIGCDEVITLPSLTISS